MRVRRFSNAQIAQNHNLNSSVVRRIGLIIIKFMGEDIPCIHMLREVAVTLRKHNMTVNDFPRVVRLKKILVMLRLSE